MELTVTQENLQKALGAVSRVAGNRELPILNNILLRTDGNRLLVAATNLEIASTQYIGAKITKPGQITIPAKLITEFVSNIPRESVELKVDGTKLRIKSGRYISTLNGVDAEDFPELPTINEKEAVSYSLSAQDFKQAAAQTIIAASTDGARPVLTGVYWHSHEGYLYLAATDGYRLSERKLAKTSSEVAAIVPLQTMQEILRLVDDDAEEVEVFIDNEQVHFRVKESEIFSRLVDGNFPDYRQLIPSKNEINAVINRQELARITKISGLFSRDSGGSVTINLDAGAASISMHSIASELGENTSEASADVDNSGQITLNSRYITDALGVLDAEKIQFSFNGKMSPSVFTAAEGETDFYHIIMPLKS